MDRATMDADVVVAGGGAAGLMAAGRAAERGARVLLLEKMEGCGKKILVSGKTRCNLTNAADLKSFIAMYGPNGRFLHGAFSRFSVPSCWRFSNGTISRPKWSGAAEFSPFPTMPATWCGLFKNT